MMVTLFSVVLMAKIPSPSVLLTEAAIAWICTGRRQAATAPAGRGVLRLHLQQLRLLATPRVVMPSRSAPKRTSTSSRRSSGRVKRPCRTGGGLIFAGNSEKKLCSRRRSRAAAAGEEAGGAAAAEEAGGAGEEARGALTNKSSFTILLCH